MKIPNARPLFVDGVINPVAEHVVRHTVACKRKANRESGAGGQNASLQMRDMDRRCTCGHSAAGNPRAVPVWTEFGRISDGGLEVHQGTRTGDGLELWRPLDNNRPEDRRWWEAWGQYAIHECRECGHPHRRDEVGWYRSGERRCKECEGEVFDLDAPDGPVLLVPGHEVEYRHIDDAVCTRMKANDRILRPSELEEVIVTNGPAVWASPRSVLHYMERKDLAALAWFTGPEWVFVTKDMVGENLSPVSGGDHAEHSATPLADALFPDDPGSDGSG